MLCPHDWNSCRLGINIWVLTRLGKSMFNKCAVIHYTSWFNRSECNVLFNLVLSSGERGHYNKDNIIYIRRVSSVIFVIIKYIVINILWIHYILLRLYIVAFYHLTAIKNSGWCPSFQVYIQTTTQPKFQQKICHIFYLFSKNILLSLEKCCIC